MELKPKAIIWAKGHKFYENMQVIVEYDDAPYFLPSVQARERRQRRSNTESSSGRHRSSNAENGFPTCPPDIQTLRGLSKIRSALDTLEIEFFILTKRRSRTIMVNAQQHYADVLELVDWLA